MVINKLFQITLLLSVFLIVFQSCNDRGTNSSTVDNDTPLRWLVNPSEIIDGGPGKDGIPSIDNPKFSDVESSEYLEDDRRVTVLQMEEDVRIYPHQILDWHEVVNDVFTGRPVTISFCPLTGTSVGVEREVAGSAVEFGVSGLLYRNNLIMYDRLTDSNWSQMLMKSINGTEMGTDFRTVKLVDTKWGTAKEFFPDAQVLNRKTGFDRNYRGFAYGSNFTTNDNIILFPVRNQDFRLDAKDRVHAILPAEASESSNVRTYPMKDFGDKTTVVRDEFQDEEILVVGNHELDFASSFIMKTDFEKSLELETVDNLHPVIMQDQFGNRWDLFGHAVEGPDKGKRLTATRSYTGYWYAVYDFFPDLVLESQ